MDEALAMVYAVYQAAAELCSRQVRMRALTADEGGLAPPFTSVDAMLDDAVDAIAPPATSRAATWRWPSMWPPATSTGTGAITWTDRPLDSPAMIGVVQEWLARYPIVSVEDGLAEDDWAHWPALRAAARRARPRPGRRLALHEPGAHPPGASRRAPPTRCCSRSIRSAR